MYQVRYAHSPECCVLVMSTALMNLNSSISTSYLWGGRKYKHPNVKGTGAAVQDHAVRRKSGCICLAGFEERESNKFCPCWSSHHSSTIAGDAAVLMLLCYCEKVRSLLINSSDD